MCDILVTFAFLTPGTISCCHDVSSSVGASSCPSEIGHINENTIAERNAVVKLLDFAAGCTRVFRASLPRDAVMGELSNSLCLGEGLRNAFFVGFELATASSGDNVFLRVSKVLSAGDRVPNTVFCQRFDGLPKSVLHTTRWIVVNIFTCNNDGELFVGHVPCVVPLSAEGTTKGALLASVARVLCLNSECEELLRRCVVLTCVSDGRRLTLQEPFADDSCADQIAILYNSVDIGDVVVVAAQWHPGADRGRTPVVQGVVTRRFVQDGVTFFDVREIDTAVVMEKLTCTQLVPL